MKATVNIMIQADRLKRFLLVIYRCKKDFELLVIDKMPKTRMGGYCQQTKKLGYIPNGCVLRLWRKSQFMNMTHIHETEKRRTTNRRVERVHVPEFWRIRPTSADSTDPRFARKNVLLKEQKKRVTFL